jgi:hypothetical protein
VQKQDVNAPQVNLCLTHLQQWQQQERQLISVSCSMLRTSGEK